MTTNENMTNHQQLSSVKTTNKSSSELKPSSNTSSRSESVVRKWVCRNGYYPLVVIPFITIAWLLDVYCSMGCNFMYINIGFEPVNNEWNERNLYIGLFTMSNSTSSGTNNQVIDSLHKGCSRYDSEFYDFFIKGDKTWTVAKIMAYISASSGCLATLIIWLTAITPLPTCFFWAGVLLPSTIFSFLAGGAKFLFFDAEVCRSPIWYADSAIEPQSARTCTLSLDGILNIISCVLFLVSVVLVCMRSPKKSTGSQKYGTYLSGDGDIDGLPTHEMEDSVNSMDEMDIESYNHSINSKNINGNRHGYDMDDITINSVSIRSILKNPISKGKGGVEAGEEGSIKSKNHKWSNPKKNLSESFSENLRTTEDSFNYSAQDIRISALPGNTDSVRRSSTSSMTSKGNDFNLGYGRSTSSNPSNYLTSTKNKAYLSPSIAPSDEARSYAFISPSRGYLKSKFKKPSLTINTNGINDCENGLKSEKSSSNSKSENDEYDDDLIQQCVSDLTKSWSVNS